MGQISRQLAARLREQGKHRKPIREEANRVRESAQVPTDLKSVEQLLHDGFDPLHAGYVSVQNFVSFFAESLSVLDELDPYYQVMVEALDKYIPEGPPISPLTHSYFTCWAFFDFRFGPDLETIGTCLLDTGADMGMDPGMLEIARCFQGTRMGIYEHAGTERGKTRLRELLTDQTYRCVVPAEYAGREGELWFARLCPPFLDLIDYYVVMTTPYILQNASRADWISYLNRGMLGQAGRRQDLAEFLKYGPTLHHWNEFVFQGYHHHTRKAIFLAGLPDVKSSLPNASGR